MVFVSFATSDAIEVDGAGLMRPIQVGSIMRQLFCARRPVSTKLRVSYNVPAVRMSVCMCVCVSVWKVNVCLFFGR